MQQVSVTTFSSIRLANQFSPLARSSAVLVLAIVSFAEFAFSTCAAASDAGSISQLNHAWALESRADQSKSTADYQAAANALESYSQSHPDNQKVQRSLGYIYLEKLNEPKLAFPHLQTVYAATPDAPGWGQMLAKAAGETGRTDLQVSVLKDVAERQPNDPWCRLDLAKALEKKKRYHEADQAYQDALKIAPDDEWVNTSYAQFLKSQGRSEEAERIAQNVVSKNQKYAPALTLLGDIYQDNSDFAGAQAAYNQAMLAQPGYAGAKEGMTNLQHSEAVQLKSSGYMFSGTDHFFQSESYNTVIVPVASHFSVNASYNAGWFHNNATLYPSADRNEESLGAEYIPNSSLTFDGGPSAFQVRSHNVFGFDLGTTWKINPKLWLYGAYRYNDPITDSIATVSTGMAQDVGILDGGYQITDNLSSTVNLSRANYSDGNVRNFVHVEPLTYTIWPTIQLRVGPVYELIDYQASRPTYSSPAGYQVYGPMIEVAPHLTSWLTIRARYEAAYGADGDKWGTILSAGPAVSINDTVDFTADYLYYQVPGSYSNYAGNGFQAALKVRF